MLTDFLVDVASHLEPYAPKVSVVFGESSAPVGQCPQVVVWGNSIYHSREPLTRASDDADCFYRRTYEIRYRYDTCYPIQDNDLTTAQFLEVSANLYDTADSIWCLLTSLASTGDLFDDIGGCENINVGQLSFSDPQGGIVSATGYIQVTAPCLAGS